MLTHKILKCHFSYSVKGPTKLTTPTDQTKQTLDNGGTVPCDMPSLLFQTLQPNSKTLVPVINRVAVTTVSAVLPTVAPPYCNVHVCSSQGLTSWCALHSGNLPTRQMTVERTVVNVSVRCLFDTCVLW